MDYEKKYKEAMEDASYWIKEKPECKELLQSLFPELTESEDEKIIRAIIDALYSHTNSINLLSSRGYQMENIEAWLEKQNGEDKKCADFTIYHPLKNGKGKYECIPYSFNGSLTSFSEDKDLIDFLRTCFYTKEECNEWIEKREEQKPVKVKDPFDDEQFCRGYEAGSHDAERYWSEEDESRLDHAITTLAENVKRGSAREDFEFLASLPRRFNLQPKTEWSEEDRRTIDRACVALRAYANGELPDILPSELLGYADKLQSLRPSWKPSEEQMDSLRDTIVQTKGYSYSVYLPELYEQLKKL